MVALLLPMLLASAQGTEEPTLLLPGAPAGCSEPWVQEALALVSADSAPLTGDAPPWPAFDDLGIETGWASARPWKSWVERVAAEALAEEVDPRVRAELAILAALQSRDADAWAHAFALRASPAAFAYALPYLMPGVPPTTKPAPGGLSAALEDGVLLRPVLPPPDRSTGRLAHGARYEHRGFLVGSSTVSLTVIAESDGVEIDLALLAGPPVRLRLRPPAPAGMALRLLYLDWLRVEAPTEPLLVDLTPEASTHEVWARFESLPPSGPRSAGSEALAYARRAGLVLELGDELGAFGDVARRAAEAMADLLRCGVRVERRGAVREAALFEPIVVHMEDGASARRDLASLVSQCETALLPSLEPRR